MDFTKNVVSDTISIRQVMEVINNLGSHENQTLFIVNSEEKLVATVTDGDIRRGVISGCSLEDAVLKCGRKEFHSLTKGEEYTEKIKSFKKSGFSLIPIIDDEGKIVRVINLKEIETILPIDTILMAGGMGKRLRPLTDNIPKPLLKVGDKPIIQYNVDRLQKCGVNNFKVCVNYLGEKIEKFFNEEQFSSLQFEFVYEEQSFGTIGAVSLIKDFNYDTVLLMNSDLLTTLDFSEFYDFFKENDADMAVATVPYNVKIPYAVMETFENKVISFKEKPTYTYYSNAGIYLFKKGLIDLIPKNKFYNATDFMEELITKGFNVVSFPILQYWMDIGRIEDYKKAQSDIAHIRM